MTSFRKIGIILFFASLLLFFFFNFASAVEITYPQIPKAPNINQKTVSLPDYILYWFYFFIYISGILGLGVFIYGGLLYLTSAGNPARMADARDKMFNAIIGIVIILASYIILNTINPQLTIIQPPDIEELKNYAFKEGGIILYNNENCDEGYNPNENIKLQTTASISDLKNLSIEGKVGSIKFISSPAKFKSIEFYDEINYGGGPPYTVPLSLNTGDCVNINQNFGSLKIIWKGGLAAGIHFYSNSDCTGKEEIHTGSSSLSSITNPKSFKIIQSSNSPSNTYYLILHKNNDFTGKCNVIRINNSSREEIGDSYYYTSSCQKISSPDSVKSFDLFVENNNPQGKGVSLTKRNGEYIPQTISEQIMRCGDMGVNTSLTVLQSDFDPTNVYLLFIPPFTINNFHNTPYDPDKGLPKINIYLSENNTTWEREATIETTLDQFADYIVHSDPQIIPVNNFHAGYIKAEIVGSGFFSISCHIGGNFSKKCSDLTNNINNPKAITYNDGAIYDGFIICGKEKNYYKGTGGFKNLDTGENIPIKSITIDGNFGAVLRNKDKTKCKVFTNSANINESYSSIYVMPIK